MQCCANCNNSVYTNEGNITFYYLCCITNEKYLSKQAESYCCDKYTDDYLEYCETAANSHKSIED